jgi:hypothetical protein
MGEVERVNTGMRLTRAALKKIDDAADRLSRSRAAVVEMLANLHADKLSADTMIPAGAVPPDTRSPKQSRPRKATAEKKSKS